jgi:hypothetical protein
LHALAIPQLQQAFEIMKRSCSLFLVLLCLLSSCGRYEERTEEVGYKGLAKIDHFLAAQRFTERMGLKSFSYGGVPTFPPPSDATLVAPVASLQSEGILGEVSEWMDAGGNLIAYLEAPRDKSEPTKVPRSWEPFLDYFEFEAISVNELADEEFIEMEGAKSPFSKDDEDELEIENLTIEDSYDTDFAIRFLLRDIEVSEEEALSGPVLSYDYGAGTLTVLATANPFSNQVIDRRDHATLLWDLIVMGQGGEVWFVYSTRTSFFGLLWTRAPYALVALVLSVVILVWWAARGFGPRFSRGTDPSPRLDEHLAASGAFFMKHGADAVVVEEHRKELFRQLARALNQPLTSKRQELLVLARERDLLSEKQLWALTEPVTHKTLLSQLRNLQRLQKQL